MITVADELKGIIRKLQDDSGYPYKMEDSTEPARAFAYGFAIGTLSNALLEWNRQLTGGDPSGA